MLKKLVLGLVVCSLVLVFGGSDASARSKDCCCQSTHVKVHRVRCPKSKCHKQHCCPPVAACSTCSGTVSAAQSLTPVPDAALTPATPAVEAGMPTPSDPLPSVLIAPVVTLGGVQLPVSFAGLTPGQVGVYQINVAINRRVPSGISIPLVVTQAGNSTSANVRVVD